MRKEGPQRPASQLGHLLPSPGHTMSVLHPLGDPLNNRVRIPHPTESTQGSSSGCHTGQPQTSSSSLRFSLWSPNFPYPLLDPIVPLALEASVFPSGPWRPFTLDRSPLCCPFCTLLVP
jgi:hypothetical protein